ncbi:MAG: DUF342 domain-containing protein [Clostridiales bacterium]|nr:DUF342 domain-containing protein [Clostridiales bacterium]
MKFFSKRTNRNKNDDNRQPETSVLISSENTSGVQSAEVISSEGVSCENTADIQSEETISSVAVPDIKVETAEQVKTPMALLAQKLGLPATDNLNSYFLHGNSPDEDERAFWNILTEKARVLLDQILKSEETSSLSEAGVKPLPFSSKMHMEVYISADSMEAYGFIFPPIGGGDSLSADELKAIAQREGVFYGMDEEIFSKILSENQYLKVFTFARGKEPRNGENGQVIDLYSREKQINLAVDQDENVDFRNLNWLQKVNQGDVICKLIPPVPPEDGMNIRGIVLKGLEGKMPKLPKGKNITENEDHTALIAEVSGQLSFSNGSFKIEQLLNIDGDVDSSVGNLDAIGSINIKGNVLDGFSVKATGDIVVGGTVMSAELTAGGNIQIRSGMNGGLKGKLTAGGNISSKYLENCFVSAGGTVKSDSVMNCTVISGDKVIVTSGHGAIMGSTITSFKGVEAKVIGNERNLFTKITIGNDPKLSEELRVLTAEIKELSHKAEEYEKNIQYLTKMESLDEVHQKLLNKLKLDLSIINMNLSRKNGRIAVIETELKGESCQITAGHIYPPLSVTIGSQTQQFFTESHMSRIYKKDGEIVVGAK